MDIVRAARKNVKDICEVHRKKNGRLMLFFITRDNCFYVLYFYFLSWYVTGFIFKIPHCLKGSTPIQIFDIGRTVGLWEPLWWWKQLAERNTFWAGVVLYCLNISLPNLSLIPIFKNQNILPKWRNARASLPGWWRTAVCSERWLCEYWIFFHK
jgi:hypothetical protein